ncbi:hypothetical protein BC943DRAFT_137091 [Umbelopsis sp. AD052]|nr:hypothetical protein BC943DRAFT_137091 [Umbelopsis sp. AD052]
MAHGKQRFKDNRKQRNSYGQIVKSHRKHKSPSGRSPSSDPVMSQIMSKFTGKRKHQFWGNTNKAEEQPFKRSKHFVPQHQFEDMSDDEDDGEEYQSDTSSLPDTLDQRFEWTDGDANEGSELREKDISSINEPHVMSLGWGGALSYKPKVSADASNLQTSIASTDGDILPWVIDTEGTHGRSKGKVPDYEIINISDSEEDEVVRLNKDNTEFARSSTFIKLATPDNRSTRKEGRKKRKSAKSKGGRRSAEKAQKRNRRDEDDMEMLQDYLQNIGEDAFNLEDQAFYGSDIEEESSYYISSDLESESNRLEPGTINRYPPSDIDSDEDLLFAGYNAWDIPDPEYQDTNSHNMFKRVINGSFEDIPPSLHNGLRARMRRQKNAGTSIKTARPINYENSALHLSASPHVNLYQLDKTLRSFVSADDMTSVQMSSISKRSDQCVITTANFYGFIAEAVTHRSKSYIMLHKTENTGPPSDRSELDEYISQAQAELLRDVNVRQSTKRKTKQQKVQVSKRSHRNSKSSGIATKISRTSRVRSDSGKSAPFMAAPSHGTVVGGEALPIHTSNVGHRMLAAMGWKEGDSLGAKNTGIKAPIQAVIRKKRAGLGI